MDVIRCLLLGALPSLMLAVEIDPLTDPLGLGSPAPQVPAEGLPDDTVGGGQIWFGKRLVVDTWDIVSSPFDWSGKEWAIAGTAVGATVATGLFVDRYFQDESQESHNPDKDRWSGTWGELGTLYSIGVLGAAGAYGWIADDERGVNVLVDGLEASVIASLVLAPILKYTVGRSRPNQTGQDSDVFQPFSGEASFPSGHTTQAFTVASVLAFSFDDQPVVGCVAFAVATGVGLSRINADRHYASDVMGGAILGTWVGYEVVHYNRRRRGEEAARSHGITDAKLDLILEPDRQGISLTWHW
jgi:membrane-associated phospholipid phosphatase